MTAPAARAADLRVHPAEVIMASERGGFASVTFHLASLEDTQIRVAFADFDLDAEGRLTLPARGLRSCSAWARAERTELALEAGRESDLRVRVELPEGASGTYWCLLRLDAPAAARSSGSGSVVQVVPRISVPIIVTTPEAPEAAISADFLSAARRAHTVTVALRVRNASPSAARVEVRASLEEVGAEGAAEVGKSEARFALLLPGHERVLPFEWPRTDPAAVRVRAEIEWGTATRRRLESVSPALRE